MLDEITIELNRIGALNTIVALDSEFAPDVGELVKIELGAAYWHLFPERLLALLKNLPNEAGSEAVRTAIEQKEVLVWHGPSPKGSRDESP